MATTVGNITLDGLFTDWSATNLVQTTGNTVAGYQIYGELVNDATLGNTYVIGINATATTDQVLVAGTVIYLNTDQNAATGYSPSFAAGAVGAEYQIQFAANTVGVLQAFLYSVDKTGATTLLNGGNALNYGISPDGKSVEVAVQQSMITPAGGTAPHSINFNALVNNSNGLPADSSSPVKTTIICVPSSTPLRCSAFKA